MIETRKTKAGRTYYLVRVKSRRVLVATKAFDSKSWRGTRPVPLPPRVVVIYRKHADGKKSGDYLFTNQYGDRFEVGVVRKIRPRAPSPCVPSLRGINVVASRDADSRSR
jgi:hypothetical protein